MATTTLLFVKLVPMVRNSKLQGCQLPRTLLTVQLVSAMSDVLKKIFVGFSLSYVFDANLESSAKAPFVRRPSSA